MRDKKQEVDIMAYDVVKNATEDRKLRKFLRWAIPILVIEVLATIACLIVYFVIPKNFCEISINPKNAVVYVNNEKTKRVNFKAPDKSMKYYCYDMTVEIVLPEEGEYLVEFTVSCDKFDVSASPKNAVKEDGVYKTTVNGQERTILLTSINIVTEDAVKNFKISVNINATKI